MFKILKYLNFCFKQLYSSVRTGNLETSLRLISLGAQPNYFHPVSILIKISSLHAQELSTDGWNPPFLNILQGLHSTLFLLRINFDLFNSLWLQKRFKAIMLLLKQHVAGKKSHQIIFFIIHRKKGTLHYMLRQLQVKLHNVSFS